MYGNNPLADICQRLAGYEEGKEYFVTKAIYNTQEECWELKIKRNPEGEKKECGYDNDK